MAMLKFFDYPGYNEITISDFTYESIEEAKFTYYIKYKTFLGYFVYANDPGQYFLTPIEVKFISKPGTKLVRKNSIIEEGLEKKKEAAKNNR